MKAQNVFRKTVKIACVTSVALGGAALLASGAALKALTEGAKFLKNTVQEILSREPDIAAADEEFLAAEPAEEFSEPVTPVESGEQ